MSTLSVRLTAGMDISYTGDNDFGGAIFNKTISQVIDLVNGTGAGQADILWADERTLATNTAETIDLTSVPKNPDGVAAVIAEVVAVLVINAPKNSTTANTTNLTIGGAGNTWNGFFTGTNAAVTPLRPGGFFFICNPDASGLGTVTDTSADLLRIANSSGASATYQIVVIGRTA